jgi:hypothetical protein
LSFFPKKAFLPKELLNKSYDLFKSSFAKKAFFGKKLKDLFESAFLGYFQDI